MSESQESRQPRPMAISAIEGGVIVETIYRPDTADTAFIIARDDAIETVSEWIVGDTTYVPIRPLNNLIKHQAILLPSEPIEYGDATELLTEIEQYICRYVSLSAAAVALSAAYVFLSWMYDAFSEVPYLRYRGDYGTGKSRALLVVGSLCHKAFFASGASTVSPIFHTLDTFKGTLIFDEADFRFTDEKSELVKILNNGNAKGFPVLRTHITPKNEFDPRAFSVFGPKIVGMRRSYEDRALESRFLTIEMEPGHAAGVPINLPDCQKEEALELRNKLLMYRLRNRLSVRLDPTLADPRVEPRMNQILLPLLSVVPDEALRAVIRDTAATIQAHVVSERGGSSEGQVLATVVKLLADKPEKKMPLSEIVAAFTSEFGSDYDRPIHNRWISSLLRGLGIVLYKSNGVVVVMPGQGERIAALCTRYGIGDMPGKNCEERVA